MYRYPAIAANPTRGIAYAEALRAVLYLPAASAFVSVPIAVHVDRDSQRDASTGAALLLAGLAALVAVFMSFNLHDPREPSTYFLPQSTAALRHDVGDSASQLSH